MRFAGIKLLLVVCLHLSTAALCAYAQAEQGAEYQARRQKAAALFNQGKRLEALPLLEGLAKANPKDDEILVFLVASLIDHAATLSDQQIAGQERIRARDLLDKALGMGNSSALAMNLTELLKMLPASGAINFSDNSQVQQIMREGEAAFARRNFDEAIKDYGKALAQEPRNYCAALFTGNTYDRENNFAKAAEWYERAIQLDPDVETAYRYYADMLAKQGEMARSRTMLIHAAVAEPYNKLVWRELNAWATLNNTKINVVYIGIPAPLENSLDPNAQPPDATAVWHAYWLVRTNWQGGGEFKKRYAHEQAYRRSLPEETEALTAAAQQAEKLAANKKSALVNNDVGLSLLLKLYRAALIEPYVFISLGDSGIARDYAAYRAKHRDKLEEYMENFVVPAK
jgi:tetratricopeptide (TPR) repeat protein